MNSQPATNPTSDSQRLLEVIETLVKELNPHRTSTRAVTLDSSFERDLAIDSLSRMELLTRLERTFDTAISEQTITSAETPRDLLRSLSRPVDKIKDGPSLEVIQIETTSDQSKPEDALTLVETLDWHVRRHPERTHLHFYDEANEVHTLTYGELSANAMRAAHGLRDAGLEPGQAVAIMLPTSLNYFFVFVGILMAGGVPVPIYPPVRASQIEDHVLRHGKILSNALVTMLVTFDQVKSLAVLLRSQVPGMKKILTPGDLLGEQAIETPANIAPDDIALLQYTSGSTGNPKGVVLTHADILANIRAMDRALETTPNDVFVSWLPLYHDMGLIGAWMGSLYVGFTLVLMSPLTFLSRPARWLQAIHKHRGTVSGGPNFAYELCVGRIADEDIQGLDLSSWRLAFNGAEPVSGETIRRFTDRFESCGLQKSAMAPVYGLAEATLGVAFPPVGRGLLSDVVSREVLASEGRAQPVERDDPLAVEIVACGQPMTGYQVRITDSNGRELPDRYQGRLEFKGPSTTSGYYRNPEATNTLFRNGWLDSGDLAYVADGDIYITSREKDMIIRAGRNIYPYELEEAVGDLEGIRKGCVAVFSSHDAAHQTEKLVIVAETRETDANVLASLHQRIDELAVEILGVPLDDVKLAPPRSVLKTSSGKIRRSATSENYQQGTLGAGGRSVAWQVARLTLAGFVPQLRRSLRSLREWSFAGWMWTVLGIFAVLSSVGILALPTIALRWRFVRSCARAVRWLTALPVDVTGLEHLPRDRSFVLVSNHQSYIDAPVLAGILPLDVRYVAKAELKQNPILGPVLTRLGLQFVDRFDTQRSVEDAQRIGDVLDAGAPVAFFAEGTLRRMPGLLPFQMGAFVTAAAHRVPIVPVTLRGTRSVLRDESWFPRHGRVRVIISPPIVPESENGTEWSMAVELRDRSRAEILKRVAEPDLVEHRITAKPEDSV